MPRAHCSVCRHVSESAADVGVTVTGSSGEFDVDVEVVD
jgi:molybdate-binding protein